MEKEPQVPRKKKIFISYGRKDAQELAFKLKSDLEELGHDVWLDKEQIRSGTSWEQQIEDAILKSEIFIALLSPYAVRRPDGVCLDEISMARYNSRKIIPAMVLMCRPPLGIYRLDWVDFQNWKQKKVYDSAFSRLLATLDKEVVTEGTYARIFSELRPLDFGAEIAEYTQDFIGRTWLLNEVENWLKNETSRVFLITGDPGIGKSAIMGFLAEKHPKVIASHFCDSDIKDTLETSLFIKSLAAQLATQLENYRDALESVDLEHLIDLNDPGTLMKRLIIDPLKAEHSLEPKLIVIDALDEVLSEKSSQIIKILRKQLKYLPNSIRLVLSSRNEPKVIDSFSKFNPHEIGGSDLKNIQDIELYLKNKLDSPKIMKKFAEGKLIKEKVSKNFSIKSEGNFRYIKDLLDGIEEGSIDPSHPENFPTNLIEFYMDFFERKFPDENKYKEVKPILEIILASREPLTSEQIGYFLDCSSLEVEQKMQSLASYFPKRANCYKPYHKALKDWLLGEKIIGNDTTYRINPEAGHILISNKLLQSYKMKEIDNYLLSYLPTHLLILNRLNDAVDLLFDLFFIENCIKYDKISNLLRFYADILKFDSISVEIQKTTQDFQYFLRNQAHIFSKFSKSFEKYPQLIAQQAANQPNSSRVSKIGRDYLKSLYAPSIWFVWKNKPYVKQSDIRTFFGHSDRVFGCTFSPNGKQILSISWDRSIILREVGTGETIRIFELPFTEEDDLLKYQYKITEKLNPCGINCCCFSPDGQFILSASGFEKKTKLWDINKGIVVHEFEGHKENVYGCDFSPSGTHIVTCSGDTTLKLWDMRTYNEICTLKGHNDQVLACKFSPDSTRIISASMDNTLKLWDVKTGKVVHTFTGHVDQVFGCKFSLDGTKVISASGDKTLILWDVKTGTKTRTFSGHKNQVFGCDISRDGKRILSSSGDHTLKIWDVETGQEIETFIGHSLSVYGCSFAINGKEILSASEDHTLKIWNIGSGVDIESRHMGWVLGSSFSPDGTKVLSSSADSTLKLWDTQTGNVIHTFFGHSDEVSGCAFSPNGSEFCSVSFDKTLRFWDLKTGKTSVEFSAWPYKFRDCAFSPDGSWILIASTEKFIQLCAIDKIKHIGLSGIGGIAAKYKGHVSEVLKCDFSPDGKKILSASADGTLKLWDIFSGKEIFTFTGHSGYVYGCRFSPDGRWILSASSDNSLKLWDSQTGEEIRTFTGHTDWIYSCDFSTDGRRIISASRDETLRIWDIETGTELMFFPTNGANFTVSVSVKDLIACGDSSGKFYILELRDYSSL